MSDTEQLFAGFATHAAYFLGKAGTARAAPRFA